MTTHPRVAPEPGAFHAVRAGGDTTGDRGWRTARNGRRTAARHRTALHDALAETRAAWPGLGFYERFEQVVCLALIVVISGVVVALLAALLIRVGQLLLLGVVDPAEPAVFQAIFGMIVTVLIALEFNHTLLGVLERRRGIVQVRTVVLIALLAIARKFLILDLKEVEHTTLLGLAGAALALGGVYWLVGDQDRRDAEASGGG